MKSSLKYPKRSKDNSKKNIKTSRTRKNKSKIQKRLARDSYLTQS
jgi:hypothetical protein